MKSRLLLVLTALLMFMCSEGPEPDAKAGRVSFGFSNVALSSGRTATEELDVAIVTIEDVSGKVIYDGVIPLTAFGDSYVSEELNLLTGSYNLTKFILAHDGQAKYATPIAGSEKAPLVERPLPIAFDVQEEATTRVVPEVISINGAGPGTFGYVEFGFEIVDDEMPGGFKSFIVAATIAESGAEDQSVNGTLQAIAKNEHGDEIWSGTWTIDQTQNIEVPIAHRYAFKLSKSGYISHNQYYRLSDLNGVNNLFFELIPEGSKEFTVTTLFDGNVTLYLPVDRAKIYARMDIAEGVDYEYLYADRAATSVTGVTLVGLYLADVYYHNDFSDQAVNLFDNVPFAKVPDLRDNIDMTRSAWTKDFDRDVVVDSYVYISVPATHGYEFFQEYYYWDFDYAAFYAYWCAETHNQNMCDAANDFHGESNRLKGRLDSLTSQRRKFTRQ